MKKEGLEREGKEWGRGGKQRGEGEKKGMKKGEYDREIRRRTRNTEN